MSVIHFDSHIGWLKPIYNAVADDGADTWDPEVLGKLRKLEIWVAADGDAGGGISHYA